VTLGVISPDWPAPSAVNALVTQRTGGSSRGSFASLNLGAHVGDAAAAVAANRGALVAELGLPAAPFWMAQVHGREVVDLDLDLGPRAVPEADGAVTSQNNRVCAVLTADCLPVLFASVNGTRVGVAHAGWRGLANGILPATVSALGCEPSELIAWLGPAISAEAYEVGDDVRTEFLATNAAAEQYFSANDRGRWQADLYGLARQVLSACGVRKIYGGDLCTFGSPEQYFSHRRESPCGRMATLIWLSS
jgi:polyphenol oxidase